jgi:hypothetical protein
MEDLGADRMFTDILKLKVTEIICYCVNQIQPSQGMVKQQNIRVSYRAGKSELLDRLFPLQEGLYSMQVVVILSRYQCTGRFSWFFVCKMSLLIFCLLSLRQKKRISFALSVPQFKSPG